MQDPSYAKSIFDQHINLSKTKKGKSILELGPGDSSYSAFFAMNNFNEITLIDKDISSSLESIKTISKNENLQYQILKNSPKVFLLKLFNKTKEIKVNLIEHDFTKGLEFIPKQKFEIIFSNAVIQHMSRLQLINFLEYLSTNSVHNSTHSHQVRFTDHLTGDKQEFFHRKVPNIIWNSRIMQKMPFWTNRLKPHELLKIFNNYNLFQIDKATLRSDLKRHNYKLKYLNK